MHATVACSLLLKKGMHIAHIMYSCVHDWSAVATAVFFLLQLYRCMFVDKEFVHVHDVTRAMRGVFECLGMCNCIVVCGRGIHVDVVTQKMCCSLVSRVVEVGTRGYDSLCTTIRNPGVLNSCSLMFTVLEFHGP
jgi:hypothetical protein